MKFLAFMRRLFLAGTISLILIIALSVAECSMSIIFWNDIFGKWFLLFSGISPIMSLVFLFISTAYIRKNGQFAAYQQTRKFSATLFQVVGSDVSSPFRKFVGMFQSKKKLEETYSQIAQPEIASLLAEGSGSINRTRFLWVLLRTIIYCYGIISAVGVLPGLNVENSLSDSSLSQADEIKKYKELLDM